MTPDVTAASRWSRWRDWLDDRANPMLIKDLRLWLRAKSFMAVYFGMLAVALLIATLYTVSARSDGSDGRFLWVLLCATLAMVNVAVMPFFVFERFNHELSSRATELVLLSNLSPARLILGKLASVWCACALCASALSPMFVTAYLLGGIDASLAAYGLLGIGLASLCMPVVDLYLATLGGGGSAMARRGGALFLLVFRVGLVLSSSAEMSMSMRGYGFATRSEAWPILLWIAVWAVLTANFVVRITEARIRPNRGDRDARPRAAFTLLWCGGFLASFVFIMHLGGWAYYTWDVRAAYLAAHMMVVLAIGMFFLSDTADSHRARWSDMWAKRPIRRLFLSPGIRRLIAFFLLHAVVCLALAAPSLSTVAVIGLDYREELAVLTGSFMAVAIGLSAHFYIVKPLFRRRQAPPIFATILAANLLPGLFFMVMYILHEAEQAPAAIVTLAQGLFPLGVMVAHPWDWQYRDTISVISLLTAAILLISLVMACFMPPKNKDAHAA